MSLKKTNMEDRVIGTGKGKMHIRQTHPGHSVPCFNISNSSALSIPTIFSISNSPE
jgi:hypothetical protein